MHKKENNVFYQLREESQYLGISTYQMLCSCATHTHNKFKTQNQ